MNVVVAVLVILMSMIVGYLISEWVHNHIYNVDTDKEDRRRKKEFYRKRMEETDESYETTIKTRNWDINFHSISTQEPPRTRITTLEFTLKAALKNENYEYAAKLRDRINEIKNNKSNEDR